MDFLNRYKFAQHNLFRGLNLTMAKPMTTNEFVTRVRTTWEVLRFQEPIIALHTEFDSQEAPFMTYRAVESLNVLRDWSDRTVRFCEGETDLDDLRFEKGQNRVPEENGDQTFLYVVARSPTSYGLLFHSHHAPVDGVGMKIMFTKFCKIFASGIDSSTLAWGTEGANLAPGFLSILNEKEVLDGPLHDKNLNTVVDDYFHAMKRRTGFKYREVRPGPTRRHHITLSVEETSKLLKGVKSLGYTLNVVAHAALCIMTHRENPKLKAMPPDAAYVFYGLVNSRDRLAPPYNGRDAFTGWGLGITCLQIPVAFVAFATVAGDVGQLKVVSEAVKAEYIKQKEFPSLLAVEERMTETILNDVTPGVRPAPWMTPSFSGDGKGEVYMDREYSDPEGNPCVSIDDFFPSVNMIDPGSFFRLWSWRDQMTLSVDYNTAVVSKEEISILLDDWLNVMRRCYVS